MAYRLSDPDRSAIRRDSPVVRAPKEADHALGCSRGGFRTQDGTTGHPLRLRVTGACAMTALRPDTVEA